jgi:hypothetical protein
MVMVRVMVRVRVSGYETIIMYYCLVRSNA